MYRAKSESNGRLIRVFHEITMSNKFALERVPSYMIFGYLNSGVALALPNCGKRFAKKRLNELKKSNDGSPMTMMRVSSYFGKRYQRKLKAQRRTLKRFESLIASGWQRLKAGDICQPSDLYLSVRGLRRVGQRCVLPNGITALGKR
jgi:hypothetical protein